MKQMRGNVMVSRTSSGLAALLASTGLAAVMASSLLASAAMAQTSSSKDGSASTSGGTVAEVIVTAQKRSENLQKTSITATVLGQSELDAKHVNNLQALQQVVRRYPWARRGSPTASISAELA